MLADPTATTVVYMPRKTIGEMAARAIANGLDAATPAVAVINATRPDEAIVAATLAEIGDRLDRLPAEGPAIVVIGLVLQELNLRGQSDDRSASPETVTRQCAQGGDAVLFYRPPLRMTSP
jgi:siroheme synthase